MLLGNYVVDCQTYPTKLITDVKLLVRGGALGLGRSCVKDSEDMPRLLVGWAGAVEAVSVEAVAGKVAAIATARRTGTRRKARRRSASV
uniref:Uncharacterized protein n=1 Tax=Oryza brachyantha TaxID=4533 RepID=J3LBD6_ORYBR